MCRRNIKPLGVFLIELCVGFSLPDLRIYPHLIAAVDLGDIFVAVSSLPKLIGYRGQNLCQLAASGRTPVESINHVSAIVVDLCILGRKVYYQLG